MRSLLVVFGLAAAQVYDLASEALPPSHSLHVVYSFYVFGVRHASDKRNRDAFVKLEKVRLTGDAPGITMLLVPHHIFWEKMSPTKFCCHEEDAAAGRCKLGSLMDADKMDYVYSLSDASQDEKKRIDQGGSYFLVLANCGDTTDVRVDGHVILKHTYGYLPGLDYAKLPFYRNLAIGYMVLAIWWMAQSGMWRMEIGQIHVCIVVVILISLFEAFLWWEFYSSWNRSGIRSRVWFMAAILATVFKSAVSYMLLLVASMGWGVNRPFLERSLVYRITGVGLVFTVFDTIRETVLSFRHSHSLGPPFVLLCLVPVSMLVAGIFVWVFASLADLMKNLAERKQNEKLRLITILWRVLCLTMAVGTVSLLYQMSTFHVPIAERWHTHWLLTDGGSHGLFFFVLTCIMYLWAPHKYSQQYAYSSAEDKAVEDEEMPEIDADAAEQPDSDDEYWTNVKVGNALGTGGPLVAKKA